MAWKNKKSHAEGNFYYLKNALKPHKLIKAGFKPEDIILLGFTPSNMYHGTATEYSEGWSAKEMRDALGVKTHMDAIQMGKNLNASKNTVNSWLDSLGFKKELKRRKEKELKKNN